MTKDKKEGRRGRMKSKLKKGRTQESRPALTLTPLTLIKHTQHCIEWLCSDFFDSWFVPPSPSIEFVRCVSGELSKPCQTNTPWTKVCFLHCFLACCALLPFVFPTLENNAHTSAVRYNNGETKERASVVPLLPPHPAMPCPVCHATRWPCCPIAQRADPKLNHAAKMPKRT